MRTSTTLGLFRIGPHIGQGAFGKIFAARDTETGLVYAIKNESATAERKTLAFETKILANLQNSPYFPRLFESGETHSLAWVAMELIGPSLGSVLKRIPSHRLSLSTTIRTARHTLHALRDLHTAGFIHRDLKPGNLLVRLAPDSARPPVCLIDFGLVRIFRDPRTHAHERPRQRTGFRGTKTYASANAHALMDLSRRDDLASWFYVLLDMALGGLPWKGVSEHADVALMKKRFDVREAVQDLSPRLLDIWSHIAGLGFESEPDYVFILGVLDEICRASGFDEKDEYDWAEFIEQYRQTLTAEFGVALRLDGGADILPYYSELGVPAAIRSQVEAAAGRTMRSPLVRSRNYSLSQASELNETDEKRCGCC
jgi:serine/threonine protein kinase